MMNVVDGEYVELTCPFQLGALADYLDPYTLVWQVLDSRGFELSIISNDNRLLMVLVDGTTRTNMYRCVLRLKRCDITTQNGSPRCPQSRYFGPTIQFQVIGKDDYSLP